MSNPHNEISSFIADACNHASGSWHSLSAAAAITGRLESGRDEGDDAARIAMQLLSG